MAAQAAGPAGPLVWPLYIMRLGGLWGARGPLQPLLLVPATTWLFVLSISCAVGPAVANAAITARLPAIIESSTFVLLSLVCLMKVFVMGTNGGKISAILESFQTDFDSLEELVPNEAHKHNEEAQKAIRKFSLIFLSAQSQSMLLTICLIAYNVLVTNTRKLPFLLPEVVLTNATVYWAYVANLLVTQYFYITGTAAFDVLYMALCMLLTGKGRILGAMFNRIQQRRALGHVKCQAALWNTPDSERGVPGRHLVRELHTCVQYHQKVIRLHEQVEGLFARSMLYIMLYFVVALGAPALRLLQDKNARVEDVMLQISLAAVNLTQLAFVCCFGDLVAEASEKVRHTAFLTYRQAMSPHARSALVMILLRTGKPLYLTADRAVYLTVNLLMAVLRRSHSLYSAAFNLR